MTEMHSWFVQRDKSCGQLETNKRDLFFFTAECHQPSIKQPKKAFVHRGLRSTVKQL